MSDGQPPVHFGGPLGLAGLAMLAGATGLFVMAGSGGPTPASQSAPQPAVAQASAPGKVKPVPDLHPGDALPVVRPAELPASAETKQPAETKLAQLSPDGSEIVYIVRIKGEPEIDVISRNFKRDRAAADIAWANLQSRNPVLQDFRLVGASYSGEIRLGYRLPPGLEPTRATINEIQSRIMQLDSVAYADPDYVAQPGKE
ncbi:MULTISPECIES: hypothetical protein [Hyphomonas]|uniref:hypothetical protein n=1 Tax=Hyphomonas TaxID=85 RepID=UPI000C48BBA0|nr:MULTISPECIES: hypothetical protein [Hyphomonas]MBB39688.1 hypothetical protein [Hyphomonas sp.]